MRISYFPSVISIKNYKNKKNVIITVYKSEYVWYGKYIQKVLALCFVRRRGQWIKGEKGRYIRNW